MIVFKVTTKLMKSLEWTLLLQDWCPCKYKSKDPHAKKVVLRRKQPCQHLDLGYLASRTVDNKPPVEGILSVSTLPAQDPQSTSLRERESLDL